MTPTTGIASEGGHWYTRDGAPAYEIPAKSGAMRAVTLRDARSLELLPSVSGIIRMAAAPGLENWKVDQGIMAALTLPRREDEAEAAWLVRVKQDSQEQGRAAADRGTQIHAQIERYLGAPDQYDPSEVVAEVMASIERHFGDYDWTPERSFAHSLGYGGKVDALADHEYDGIVLDFKTKDAWTDDKKLAYDEHLMQLAAYRIGLGYPNARCANVFISRQEPWQVYIHEWTQEQLERGFQMFAALLSFWKCKNNFDPAWSDLPEIEF